MSFQKFYLIPEKNMSRFCEESNKSKMKTSAPEDSVKEPLQNVKPTSISSVSDNMEDKGSEKVTSSAENNLENSNLFKDKNKVTNLDLDSIKTSSEAPPPPGVPSTKRKRVIEGNSSVGAGVLDVGYKSTKIPKKLNWIQI